MCVNSRFKFQYVLNYNILFRMILLIDLCVDEYKLYEFGKGWVIDTDFYVIKVFEKFVFHFDRIYLKVIV